MNIPLSKSYGTGRNGAVRTTDLTVSRLYDVIHIQAFGPKGATHFSFYLTEDEAGMLARALEVKAKQRS